MMNGPFQNEFGLLLELKHVIEIKHIRIGFNSVWTDYNNKILGVPSSVLLEGGMSAEELVPMGQLELIRDEGYSNFAVYVFKKNFQQLHGSSIEESFKSLQCTPVKFLRLLIRRPVVTFVESLSLLNGKPYKELAISISFLTVIGHDCSKTNVRPQLIDE